MKQRLLSEDADDLQVRERLISKVSTVSTTYSIVSSNTPHLKKKHHTMNTGVRQSVAPHNQPDLEKQAERAASSETTDSASTPNKNVLRKQPL